MAAFISLLAGIVIGTGLGWWLKTKYGAKAAAVKSAAGL